VISSLGIKNKTCGTYDSEQKVANLDSRADIR
jgi:hypothetical protein